MFRAENIYIPSYLKLPSRMASTPMKAGIKKYEIFEKVILFWEFFLIHNSDHLKCETILTSMSLI